MSSELGWSKMSRRDLITKLSEYRGKLKILREKLELIEDEPTRFLIGRLQAELKHQQNLVSEKTKELTTALDLLNQTSNQVSELSGKLSKSQSKNTKLERLRAEQEQFTITIKKQRMELKREVETLSKKVENLKSENKDLSDTVKEYRNKVSREVSNDTQTEPTREEIRAAFKLNVRIRELRAWAKEGCGPQPPYTDLDDWTCWVDAHSGRGVRTD